MTILALWSEEDLENVISGAQIDPVRKDCGDVGQSQLALQQQGYYDGPLTGAYNDEMGEAMQAFLQDHGLPPSASGQDFCVALRNAQIKLSSDARSELNSRIFGISPLVILGSLAVAGAAWWKWGRGYRWNKGHRVHRNRVSVIEVHGDKPWADPWDNPLSKRVGAVVRAAEKDAEEGDSGAGESGWDSSYEIQTRNVSKVMSALRKKFRREVSSGKLSFRVKRNLRGSAPERGNRGRRR